MTAAWPRFRALVERYEQSPVGPGQLAFALAAIIAVRNLLELVVARNPVFEPIAAFVHYPLAYVAPFFALTLVLAGWSGVAPARVARLMLGAWLLTLGPPLVDLLLHRTHEAPTIGYLHADPTELGWTLLHFFDPGVTLVGTTLGIRAEIAAAVLLGALYVLLRCGSWWRSALAALTVWAASMFFLTLPVLVLGAFRWLNPALVRNDLLWGEGVLHRAAGDTAPDSVAVLWLVPLLVLTAGAGFVLERRVPPEERWLRGALAASIRPGLDLLLGAVLLAGAVAGLYLFLPQGQPWIVAPFDSLALVAAPLAVLLLAGTALRRDGTAHGRAALAVAGVSIACALGRAVALPLAAAVAPLVFVDAGWLPAWSRRPVTVVAIAVAALASFAAGFSLVLGPDALARLPFDLLLVPTVGILGYALYSDGSRPAAPWVRGIALGVSFGLGALFLGSLLLAGVAVACGAVAAFAGAYADSSLPDRTRGRWSGALAGLALLVLIRWLTAVPSLQGPLSEEIRCVARLHVIRAEEYERKGEWLNARSQYQSARQCDPGSVSAARGLGLGILRNENRVDRGIELLQEALDLAPGSPVELGNLASAFIQAGRPADAVPLLDRALAIEPRDPDALFNRARALDDAGRPDEAADAWGRFVARVHGNPEHADDLVLARSRLRALRAGAGAGERTPSHPARPAR